jgi:hypothetical protein
MSEASLTGLPNDGVFVKETLIRGAPAQVRCVEIEGRTLSINRGALSVASVEDEWYEDLDDPAAVIGQLQARTDITPDLLTFWQRLPDVQPRFSFHLEWDEIAVLPVTSYEHWWKCRIKSRVRNHVRHAERQGVVVKRVPFDDDFVAGMTAIFNEVPVRQGRRFWHYGKDFETVKRQFSRFLFREHMIGAYYHDEMIGFIMLGNAGRYGITAQILSSIRHREKNPNNALIAKAVEVCVAEKLPYLVYAFWTDDSRSQFKRSNGFECVRVPRYYVPLTRKGRVVLKFRAHRGLKAMLPGPLSKALKRMRERWYERRAP